MWWSSLFILTVENQHHSNTYNWQTAEHQIKATEISVLANELFCSGFFHLCLVWFVYVLPTLYSRWISEKFKCVALLLQLCVYNNPGFQKLMAPATDCQHKIMDVHLSWGGVGTGTESERGDWHAAKGLPGGIEPRVAAVFMLYQLRSTTLTAQRIQSEIPSSVKHTWRRCCNWTTHFLSRFGCFPVIHSACHSKSHILWFLNIKYKMNSLSKTSTYCNKHRLRIALDHPHSVLPCLTPYRLFCWISVITM